jgi:glutathione synthase/RimK-type ligase-like ATP-grasp enzyme
MNSDVFEQKAAGEMPKAMAIYCPVSENNNPFSEDYYWQAYQDLMLALKQRGVEVYLVTDEQSYAGNGLFSTAYTITEKTSLDNLTKVENVSVDIVFDRSDFVGENVVVINDPYVYNIGTDKVAMYENFARFQPFSIVCQSHQEIVDAFAAIEGSDIVVKKPVSYGAHDVYIGKKEEVLPTLPDEYPLLVQEFLDTSAGVDGHMTGVHDVRLSMCGGELIGCYIRQARPGSVYSNVSQGGKMLFMNVKDAPPEAVEAAKEVDKLFAAYPRYFSVDFISTSKGWKMLEINALLALLPRSDGPEAEETLEKLADYFASVCTDVHARRTA